MTHKGLWIFSIFIVGFAIISSGAIMLFSNKFTTQENWGNNPARKQIESTTPEASQEATSTIGKKILGIEPNQKHEKDTNGKMQVGTPSPMTVGRSVYDSVMLKDASDSSANHMKSRLGMDGKGRAWYVNRNAKHTTPQIPASIASMLRKQGAYYVGDTSQKMVYLTFDEGYENGYTPNILDILKSKNQTATFFITGDFVKTSKPLIRRMIQEGHNLGNHTVSHLSLNTLTHTKFISEIKGLEKTIKSEFDFQLHYLRPPKGDYNEIVLNESKKLGYKTIFWSIGFDDFDTKKQKGAKYSYDMVMNNLHPGAIILLHAVSKDNAEILGKLIDDIRQKGYQIRAIDF